jgi:hypothetical protein
MCAGSASEFGNVAAAAGNEWSEDTGMSIEDPLSALRQEAVGLHEMFNTFVMGGFTESQALELIAKIIVLKGEGWAMGFYRLRDLLPAMTTNLGSIVYNAEGPPAPKAQPVCEAHWLWWDEDLDTCTNLGVVEHRSYDTYGSHEHWLCYTHARKAGHFKDQAVRP